MKQNIYIYGLALLSSAGLLIGCNSPKKAITSNPTPYTVTPDSAGIVNLDINFNVPDHYLSKRSRLFITPTLVTGDSLIDEYTPIVLDASIYRKKTHRKEVLHGYVDPYAAQARKADNTSHSFSIRYIDSINVPEDIDAGRIVAVVSTDGCGQCSGLDTIEVAAISVPATLIDVKESLNLSWIEPEFKIRPKIAEGKGVARLQFVVDKYDIRLDMGNNRKELEDMVATIAPILQDSLATLTSLDIYGMASAEASIAHNTVLARNRANSAKNWLVNKLNIPSEVQKVITLGSRPEGWEPVYEAMVADNHPGAQEIRQILDKYKEYNDDVAEKYIRRTKWWKDIKAKYLAKDRKVEYVYTYRIKSFTNDAELLDMYKKRPDAFNEEEFLRVATLAADPVSEMEVYKTILHYFPQSKVAANNLAVLYLRAGNEEEARKVLDTAGEYTPEMLNTLAASYVYADDFEKAIELLEDIDLPAARYNLGLIKAKQRKMNEAYELLLPFADTNTAICALSVNRNDKADEVMQQVKESRPINEYVRAMIAARLGNADAVIEHLSKISGDAFLLRRAKDEPDFRPFSETEEFKAIIKE